jgi:predicted DNA-binding protein
MAVAEDHALNVRVPTELYEQLRKYAFDNRCSQADIVRDALKQFFERSPDERLSS